MVFVFTKLVQVIFFAFLNFNGNQNILHLRDMILNVTVYKIYDYSKWHVSLSFFSYHNTFFKIKNNIKQTSAFNVVLEMVVWFTIIPKTNKNINNNKTDKIYNTMFFKTMDFEWQKTLNFWMLETHEVSLDINF